MNKATIFSCLILLLTIISTIFFIKIQFNQLKQAPFIQSENKHWSHRGYATTEREENTINAIEMALENGYQGIEIDLWFKDGRFYLSHDENYADSLPKLTTVFQHFPDSYFWLDLKNLSYSNYEEIAHQLEQMKKNKKSYLIESKNGLALGLLYNKEFQTSYWLTDGNFIRQFIQKSCLVLFEYNGVSMPAINYQKENVRRKYKHLNIYLWDKNPNPEVYEWDEVKIILDDQELK